MMKNIFLLSGMIFTLVSCSVQTKAQNGKPGKDGVSSNSKTLFNQKLADSLGADQYGMKGYTIVMLTTGTAKIDDKDKKAELMKGHMENIGKLAKERKITVAGPFLEKNKENYRGMFIFNTKSKEEAESWVKTDPAVAAGLFSYEIFSWYGSAALPLYLKHHDEIAKENP
ncbi:YciI family protein [Chryseobacterium luquanense]|uniref:YciI family protein n=1 Tax=Chryseobacterium luquanense TaxID=2983766 RepID=A0ABT3Y1Y1_9FLAO|nr:YciI family protein [Chryseobacterium luquanense]MCX8532140.1 YciI family protein [Chryseobacterium luquanense]